MNQFLFGYSFVYSIIAKILSNAFTGTTAKGYPLAVVPYSMFIRYVGFSDA